MPNFEVTGATRQREQDDWARFERMRHQWEKQYRDPNDVLIEAAQRKRELRKAADKQRGNISDR